MFLLGVVTISGLYITLFFEFGFEASYTSVQSMEAHVIQRAVRALHRYSSAALVATTIVHGWRVFAAGRYTARRRRWRWVTGVTALVLVWLTGVTGYWLTWDVRAQALSEVTAALVGGTGVGAEFSLTHLVGASNSSGSGFLLFMWFVHVGLTGTIGYFIFRHLRGSKLAWFPPRHWMFLMGGALLLVSLVLPLGMLPPADPGALVQDMPVDLFVLFLLPPLLSDARWWALATAAVLWGVVSFIPKLIHRQDPAPVSIDPIACTGCELCVVDCPYNALRMVAVAGSSIAAVEEETCVACGICLGSCAFGAIELPGVQQPAVADVDGKTVVVACDRHLEGSDTLTSDHRVVVGVRCAGMFAPAGVRAFMDAGATGVQMVGCPPGDCRYGTGNTLASERLHGDRSPHIARRWTRQVAEDWVSPGQLPRAIANPGNHPEADHSKVPSGQSYLGAALLVAVSVVAIVLATRSPFRGGHEDSQVRVLVNHKTGVPIFGAEETAIARIDDVELVVNGTARKPMHPVARGDRSVGILDWPVDVGPVSLEVAVHSDGVRTVLYTDETTAESGQRVVIEVVDVPPPPGASQGREVFEARAIGCTVCHSVDPGGNGVGPSLAGVGAVAGSRVEGLTAEQYLRQSIFLPDQYIVDGWPAGQMLPIYRERLSETELEALIAYLLTLTEEGS